MKKLFILFLFAWSSFAYATGPSLTVYITNYGTFSTAAAACAAVSRDVSPTAVYIGATATACVFQVGTAVQTYQGFHTAVVCSLSSTGSTTTPDSSGNCPVVAPVGCTAGTSVAFREDFGVPSKTAGSGVPVGYVPQHYGGCAVTVTGVTACHTITATGHVTCDYTGVQTGSTAAADGSDETAVPTSSTGTTPVTAPAVGDSGANGCPAGTVQGGTDPSGIPICMGKPAVTDPAPQTTTTTPTTTTTDASGNSVASSVSTVTNSDGSSTATTTTVTTTPSGSKSTTVSSVTSAATGGGAGVPDADKPKDLCADHPELNVCQNSTVSGACAAISCTGDAIQCSILRQAADMDCKDQTAAAAATALPSTATGSSILAGNDPLASQISTLTTGTSVDLSSTALDGTGFLGGGSCLADRSFTVAGRSVAVHFSAFCGYISSLRLVVLACAAIASYMLVSKSVLQGA